MENGGRQGGVTGPPTSRTGRKHPSLFTEGKAGGLFGHINGPEHSQKLSVLGKWGLQARGSLFIIDLLNYNLNFNFSHPTGLPLPLVKDFSNNQKEILSTLRGKIWTKENVNH